MTSPVLTYVDPSIDADSGAGTSGDPYGDLQYALDTMSQGATGRGDQINIKAGSTELLTSELSLSGYGTPSFNKPLIFRGYTSTAGDGGVGVVSGDDDYAIMAGSNDGVHFINCKLMSCGSTTILTLGRESSVCDCELTDTSASGVIFDDRYQCLRNHIHSCGYNGIKIKNNGLCAWNYLANGEDSFTNAIHYWGNSGGNIENNIISISGASKGIWINAAANSIAIIGNSILADTGTASGILRSSNGAGTMLLNNLVEGFSGVGGVGINTEIGNWTDSVVGNNAVYNCSTPYDLQDEVAYAVGDNESLGASPFAKSGADTFANRHVYFAPADTGNVHGGAFQ